MSKRRREQDQARKIEDDQKARQTWPIPKGTRKPPLKPKTENQKVYINSILHNRITFGVGPAGVGKTYCAARIAARQLKEGEIDKIILSRPAVEAGESLGFLPGDVDEKMTPYIAAYGKGFTDELGGGCFEYYYRHNVIEVVPLGFMQGRSWDDPTLVLLDEAENATRFEMKMFLTRIGEGARVVIDGDPGQSVIGNKSGLIDGLQRTRYIPGVGCVSFERSDIVRDEIVKQILAAYDDTDPDTSENNVHDLPAFVAGSRN